MPIKRYITIIFAFFFMFFAPLIDAKEVYLGGNSIGIEVINEGLLISGTYDVRDKGKIYNPSVNDDIKKGDILVKVEDTKVNTLNEFIDVIKNNSNEYINVSLYRNNSLIGRKLKLIKDDDGSIKTGIYVKDNLLGIGTITYYDPSNTAYGALGHKMSDSNSDERLVTGNIYSSNVKKINKSKNGNPGEKIASINKNDLLGDIQVNNDYGIYGEYVNVVKDELIETASIEEVKEGRAYIYTVINNNIVEPFEIEITNIKKQNSKDIKGITFKVTDKRLLDITNGVVAGMSGSPIVQDGKLIGAVTHVVVDNVKYGYGIFIDWMLLESQSI
jgi:stage IV sporulation protein B